MIFQFYRFLIVFISLPLFLVGQNFNPLAPGTRARSMGGAFVGVADDVTATYYNPAGLMQLKGSTAMWDASFENYFIETNKDDFRVEPWKSQHFLGCRFGGISFQLPGKPNVVLALARHPLIDFFYQYNAQPAFLEEHTGYISANSLAVAWQVYPGVAVGATLNYYEGTRVFHFIDFVYENGCAYSEYRYNGKNINVGVFYQHPDKSDTTAEPHFRFGAIFKPDFDLWERNEGINYEATFKMPTMVGFGLSIRVFRNIIYTIDFESRQFSEAYRRYAKTYGTFKKDDRDHTDLVDINQFRMGSKYIIHIYEVPFLPVGAFKLPLYTGLGRIPTIFKDEQGRKITATRFTLGLGIITMFFNLKVELNWGFEYTILRHHIFDPFHYYNEHNRGYFFSANIRRLH